MTSDTQPPCPDMYRHSYQYAPGVVARTSVLHFSKSEGPNALKRQELVIGGRMSLWCGWMWMCRGKRSGGAGAQSNRLGLHSIVYLHF